MAKVLFLTAVLLMAVTRVFGGEAPTHRPLTHQKLEAFQKVQSNQCSRRIGPYATQDSAWRDWNGARSQGYAVSDGVFPCWDGGIRGYCFNVFFAC